MQGEINVTEAMADAERVHDWLRRQQYREERRVLEMWWTAERKAEEAKTPQQRRAVAIEKGTIKRYYRKELGRVLFKWERAKEAQRLYFAGLKHTCLHG